MIYYCINKLKNKFQFTKCISTDIINANKNIKRSHYKTLTDVVTVDQTIFTSVNNLKIKKKNK